LAIRGAVIYNYFDGIRSTWLARNFATNPDVKQAVISWVHTHGKNSFYARIKSLDAKVRYVLKC
jgi:hypothetical protein